MFMWNIIGRRSESKRKTIKTIDAIKKYSKILDWEHEIDPTSIQGKILKASIDNPSFAAELYNFCILYNFNDTLKQFDIKNLRIISNYLQKEVDSIKIIIEEIESQIRLRQKSTVVHTLTKSTSVNR